MFSIDRWMRALYWQDMPSKPDINWFQEHQQWYLERIQRCENQIKQEVKKLLCLDTSCILDLGFTAQAHRWEYIELGKALGANVEVHFLNIPKEERWARVLKRNSEKATTYSMHVDSGMFEYMEGIFEPISEAEKSFVKMLAPAMESSEK